MAIKEKLKNVYEGAKDVAGKTTQAVKLEFAKRGKYFKAMDRNDPVCSDVLFPAVRVLIIKADPVKNFFVGLRGDCMYIPTEDDKIVRVDIPEPDDKGNVFLTCKTLELLNAQVLCIKDGECDLEVTTKVTAQLMDPPITAMPKDMDHGYTLVHVAKADLDSKDKSVECIQKLLADVDDSRIETIKKKFNTLSEYRAGIGVEDLFLLNSLIKPCKKKVKRDYEQEARDKQKRISKDSGGFF